MWLGLDLGLRLRCGGECLVWLDCVRSLQGDVLLVEEFDGVVLGAFAVVGVPNRSVSTSRSGIG